MALTVAMRRQRAPEPAEREPRRWGAYRERYLVGLALILGGAALVAQTTAFTLALGALGTLLHLAGWLVEPGRLRVRLMVAPLGALLCWVSIGGPGAMWALSGLLPLWLVQRRRPPATLLLTALPLTVGLALGGALPYVADKSVVFGAVIGSVVLAAWIGRELTLRVRVRLLHGWHMHGRHMHGERIGAQPAGVSRPPVD